MAKTQRVVLNGTTTWTVVADSFAVVEPAEAYLEYCRQRGDKLNSVKSYARGLALWWTYLESRGKQWDKIQINDVGYFLDAVRHDQFDPTVRTLRPKPAVRESTVDSRLRPVLGFYKFQAGRGDDVAPFLFEAGARRNSGRYLPFLAHVAHRQSTKQPAIRVRKRRPSLPPILTPSLITQMADAEATYSSGSGEWEGDLRYRLLWELLAETGMRIGEALSLQHRDWIPGQSGAAAVSIVERPHPLDIATKSGDRKIYIGSRLDRLYADYVWWLCDRGADAVIADWDSSYIFCNVYRGSMYSPLRPESIYEHLKPTKRRVPQLPKPMTPHWFRHTHATALLLAGTPLHVVSRRLGHESVQTTLNIYGHVTEDAELKALANWREFVSDWEVATDGG